jgi:hypothetical protein
VAVTSCLAVALVFGAAAVGVVGGYAARLHLARFSGPSAALWMLLERPAAAVSTEGRL